jgi:hypothetical protein
MRVNSGTHVGFPNDGPHSRSEAPVKLIQKAGGRPAVLVVDEEAANEIVVDALE